MAQPWVWQTGYERVGFTGVVKPEGMMRPKFYWYGYEDFNTEKRVFFPFGIHWLVQVQRDVLYLIRNAISNASHHSIRERAEWAAYHDGYERGKKAALR